MKKNGKKKGSTVSKAVKTVKKVAKKVLKKVTKVVAPKKAAPITASEKKQIKSLTKQGKSQREIAQILGRSRSSVFYHLHN